ncbi:MAG: hypothetical protein V3T14_05300, partial [Myxococcota bacterium]
MSGRLQESDAISTLQALGLFGKAVRYMRPFFGRFSVKVVLTFLSFTPLLLLPWPIKVLIDHVIEGIPLGDALHS